MLRPQRLPTEVDPGPVQIQARRVHFDVDAIPLHWIPDHPIATLLTDPERAAGMMLICVSRASDDADLLLDL